jgi:glucose-6-phosphate isomerase
MNWSQAFEIFQTQAKIDSQNAILDGFALDEHRLARHTLSIAGLRLDTSKQGWSREGFYATLSLIEASPLIQKRSDMWCGKIINASEGRSVLHVALRDSYTNNEKYRGKAIAQEVETSKKACFEFAHGIFNKTIRGSEGHGFKTIIHIGIGGSDLGPRLIYQALSDLRPSIEVRFVANVDGSELSLALAGLDPRETLVVVVSKTMTTQETLANFLEARNWLIKHLGENNVSAHMVAVSAAPEKAINYGIDPKRIFGFKDWVGGRYSLWSAVSLSIMMAVGPHSFERLLNGARLMDDHFFHAPLVVNAPIMLAATQIYNRLGRGYSSRAVIPYAHRLRRLAAFLQQLEMESNGKRTDEDGGALNHVTCPVVFGDEGTNAQHAFFQMLHQSEDIIPVEFVAVVNNPDTNKAMQAKLISNVLAQAEAFMVGKSLNQARLECQEAGMEVIQTGIIAPQKVCPGNKPSSLIMLEELSPESLGALLALYEHKTFVEGVVMGINSFDQWGVELGKSLGNKVLRDIESDQIVPHDPSTTSAIEWVKKRL